MELVAFLSLLLGLVLGECEIELLVSEQVASVDLLLDSERIATLQGPPWTASCDFGDELQPHLLEAVARSAGGVEMTRARQWINLPRGHITASLMLEGRSGDGDGRVARLSWQNIYGSDPVAVTVNFDGKPLSNDRSKRIPLPPHDPFLPHFVTAWLDFGRFGTTIAEVTFGGGFGEQVRTELTAVPVELSGRSLPDHQELAGWFVSNGTALEPHRVEKGEADIILIMDDASRMYLHKLYRDHIDPQQTVRRIGGEFSQGRVYSGPDVYLGYSENLWIMATRPRHWRQERVGYEVFSIAGPYTFESGELSHRLAHLGPDPDSRDTLVSGDVQAPEQALPMRLQQAVTLPHPERIQVRVDAAAAVRPLDLRNLVLPEGPERLADAVASAGMLAASRGRRRAVVLVTSESEGPGSDAARISAQAARNYLERLHVPLLVWTVDKKPNGQSPWGKARRIRKLREVAYAFDKLSAALDKQRVVWLEGAHLPQEIDLSVQAAQRLRLAH